MKAAPPVPPMPVERGFRPTAQRGQDYASTAGRRDYRTPPPKETLQTDDSTPFRISGLLAASEDLPGLFGPLRLDCSRAACDTRRLDAGVMSLTREHVLEDAIGVVERLSFDRVGGVDQITMIGKIDESPLGKSVQESVNFGSRRGLSPGFIYSGTQFDEMDTGELRTTITRFEPYEAAVTAAARLYRATISRHGRFSAAAMSMRGKLSMSTNNGQTGAAPELTSLSDLHGLSLAVGRKMLSSGAGSPEQRQKLSTFFTSFDAAIERGLTRTAAIEVAKDASGLGG